MTVLIVAGLDSSAGAGIARDLAVLAALGVPARIAATAVTAQDGAGACRIEAASPPMVAAQIAAAGPVEAVKIGMLANAAVALAVADALPDVPVVLDPVLATSAGAPLLDRAGRAAMTARLFPRATLITPNLPEAAALTGLPRSAPSAAIAAALFALGAPAVLLKGGHAEGPDAVDWLLRPAAQPVRFSAPRLPGTRRGTGCTLATAIAAHLARGHDLVTACGAGKWYLTCWLHEGRGPSQNCLRPRIGLH